MFITFSTEILSKKSHFLQFYTESLAMQKEYGTLHHCERSEVILAECWRTKLKRNKKSMRKIGMRYEVASLSGMMDAEKECSIRVSFWMKRSVVKNLADEERL